MEPVPLLDCAGRRRSPATLSSFDRGRTPLTRAHADVGMTLFMPIGLACRPQVGSFEVAAGRVGICAWGLEAVEEPEQAVRGAVASGASVRWCRLIEDALLEFEVGV